MTKVFELSRVQLKPSDNQMSYCPSCLCEFKQKNKNGAVNFKDTLPPLVHVKKLIVYYDKDGNATKALDEWWECGRCQKHNAPEDFIRAYCLRPDGTRYSEQKQGGEYAGFVAV